MKRSEINRYLADASEFFAKHRFALPPFALWSPEGWDRRGAEAEAIRTQKLGWDLTDFGSGQFASVGLTLFTLRNSARDTQESRAYAEKIMFVREGQVTPYHLHLRKSEDIINRGIGGGQLLVELYNTDGKGRFAGTEVEVMCDGIWRTVRPGGKITLKSGESIAIPPRVYHTFRAMDGDALVGEVSSFNDDEGDNYFLQPLPRFPEIIEDEPPLRWLCQEYPRNSGGAIATAVRSML